MQELQLCVTHSVHNSTHDCFPRKCVTCGSIRELAHIQSSTLLSHLCLSFVSQHSPLSSSPPNPHHTHTDTRWVPCPWNILLNTVGFDLFTLLFTWVFSDFHQLEVSFLSLVCPTQFLEPCVSITEWVMGNCHEPPYPGLLSSALGCNRSHREANTKGY